MITRYLSHAELPELREAILASEVVAVDTEFHAENRYLPELFLLQLTTGDERTWIVDPLVPGLVAGLAEALRATPWVVHGGEHDLRILQQALGGVPEVVRDTQIEAGLLDTTFPATFAALVRRWTGVELDKAETLSDWSQRPLTPGQLAYAAKDVALLLPLARALQQELARRGRAEIARAACAEARRAALAPADEELFLEIAAVGVLEGRQLAVLQDLAVWREERARAANQAARQILSDGVLVDLARRQPTSAGSVAASRRVARSLSRHAAELAHLIGRSLQRPEPTWPRAMRREGSASRRSAFLQLWGAVAGAREGWAQPLVVPRRVADRVALAGATDRENLRSMLGWRDVLVGEELERVLAGGTALVVDGLDVAARRDPAAGEPS